MTKMDGAFIAGIIFLLAIGCIMVLKEHQRLENEVGNLYNRITELEKEVRR